MKDLIYLNDDFDSIVKRILIDGELKNCGLNEEKVSRTLKSFCGDEIACSVFFKKYALRNEENNIIEFTLDEAKKRWADCVYSAEKVFKNPSFDVSYFKELYEYMLPAGRQMFALGNDYISKATYTNCYVTKIEEDSLEGIYNAGKKLARTYSYGGGVGLCIGELRPSSSKVANSARFSSGSVSFMELYSMTTGLIGQSGRRAALMITIPVHHPDVEEFIEIKHDNMDKVKHANISIKLTDEFMNAVVNDELFTLAFETRHETIKRVVKARDLWNKIVKSARDSAEPGILFWDRMVEMSPSDTYDRLKIHSTNPCVTGDTLIYVADGRGNVPIKQLAEENKDIPVFCLNNNNNIVIRYMRNPRITGYNQPIYKITFDDGNSVKVTKNHQFKLKNGQYKCADELKYGDSLRVISRFKNKIKNKYTKSKVDYYWISDSFFRPKMEHRYIAEEFCGNIPDGYVVHHKDFNSLNNNYNNLQILSINDHNKLHSKFMLGDKNPMRRAKLEWTKDDWKRYSENMSKAVSGENNGRFSGISNEELKKHALILTKQLGYRFSRDDWMNYAKSNNLVEQFSKWRNDHLGGTLGLARWAALECGIDEYFANLDPRSQRHYKKLLDQGYNCEIHNGKIFVIKNCEICGREYTLPHSNRESGICSQECLSIYLVERNKNSEVSKRAADGSRRYYKNLKAKNAEEQVKAFINLKLSLKREPTRKEWEQYCKSHNIPYRLSKPSYFENYSKLKEAAKDYNHKVVSIESCGFEDVFNGTVDEFHNFFIGGFESNTSSKNCKWHYINNPNCGEQSLENGGTCTLASLLLHKFVVNSFTDEAYFDFGLFEEMVTRGVRHLDNVVELNIGKHALQEQEDSSRLGRRIGLGITGFADMYAALGIRYDSDEALEIVSKIIETKKIVEYKASINLAEERGSFPLFDAGKHFERGFAATLPDEIKELAKQKGLRNVAISTIAPSGSLSIIAQCSSGIEPIFALSYLRSVEMGSKNKKKFKIMHPGLSRFHAIKGYDNLPEFWVVAHQIDYRYRVKLQGILQRHIDASISSTINLPAYIDVDTVSQIYLDAWKEGLKGITVYREGAREGVLITDEYAKAAGVPDMNTVVHCIRAEGGDKFYTIISYKNGDIKNPYQVFVMNYKQVERDAFVKIGNSLVRMLREKGVLEDRIKKYINRSQNPLAKLTRFLSLSMKTDYLTEAVEILNEHAFAGTLASKLYEILYKSLQAKKSICQNKNCGSSNVKREEGCMICLDCGWSGCA